MSLGSLDSADCDLVAAVVGDASSIDEVAFIVVRRRRRRDSDRENEGFLGEMDDCDCD